MSRLLHEVSCAFPYAAALYVFLVVANVIKASPMWNVRIKSAVFRSSVDVSIMNP